MPYSETISGRSLGAVDIYERSFLAGCVILLVVVLIHGTWRILPPVVVGFGLSLLTVYPVVTWPLTREGCYYWAAACSAPAALLGSIALIRHDQKERGQSRPDTRHAWLFLVPWLLLFLTNALTSFLLHALVRYKLDYGIPAGPMNPFLLHFVPLAALAILALVLVHGGWRVAPWCLVGFTASMLTMFAIYLAEGLRLDYSDWMMMSCVPAALLGGYQLIRPSFVTANSKLQPRTCISD